MTDDSNNPGPESDERTTRRKLKPSASTQAPKHPCGKLPCRMSLLSMPQHREAHLYVSAAAVCGTTLCVPKDPSIDVANARSLEIVTHTKGMSSGKPSGG